MLKDLTPEQIDQIMKIHGDALVQEKKVREKEADDITAILTPAQVTEMKEAEARNRGAVKERRMKESDDRTDGVITSDH